METSVPPPGYVPPPSRVQPPSPVQPASPKTPGHRGKAIAAAAALVSAGAVAFLLVAPGGGHVGGPIAQAATLSASSPGYRMHMLLQVASPDLPTPVTASATGVVDLRDHASAMSMRMDLGADPQVAARLGSSTLQMRIVVNGTVMYLKLPSALTAQLPVPGR